MLQIKTEGDFRPIQTKSLALPAISNMWPIMLLWLHYLLCSHLIRRPPGPLIPIAILARKQSKEVSVAAETPCSVLYNDIRSFGGLKHLEIARMLINETLISAVPCSRNALPTARISPVTSSIASLTSARPPSTATLPSPRSTFPRQSAASSAAASPPIGQSPSTIAVRPPTK